MMAQVVDRLRPPAAPIGNEEPRSEVGPPERPGVATMVDRADTSHGGDIGNLPDAGRRLASRLITGLSDRPFRPNPDQLAWVWGGDLARGEERASRARIAAGRYATLFTQHVIEDVTIEGAPGAYARIWLCTRLAFIESMSSQPSEPPSDRALAAWAHEGGATS